MFGAWVEYMRALFIASWCTVLDESMSIWTSKFTCPGWVFCPWKPQNKGNKHHIVCCGLSGILFDFEMVEDNDHPNNLPEPEYSEHGKTAGLLLRLTKSLHNSAKYIVIDSGFCVLNAIIELKRVGMFAGALIKKHSYWPALVVGDAMDRYSDDNAVGDVAAVEGEVDGIRYNIWEMKDAGYITEIMGTALGLMYRSNRERSWSLEGGTTAQFKFTEPYELHYNYRHLVDDHNNLHHAVPSIEESLPSQRWAMHKFQFVLVVLEVFLYVTYRYFLWAGGSGMTLLEFTRALAWAFIKNPYREASPEAERHITRTRTEQLTHNLLKFPCHTS